MQRNQTLGVEFPMNIGRNVFLPLIFLAACASEPVNKPVEAVDRGSGAEMAELRRVKGCTEDQVLVCMETTCNPENYACAEGSGVRRMFETRINHWR